MQRVQGGRQSQPSNWTPLSAGGYAVIPRRNLASPNLLATGSVLQRFATSSPLRLLTQLADIDADIALALDNIDSLINAPGDVSIVAVKPEDAGQPEAEPDEAATAALNQLWEKLPPDVGGLCGLQTQGTLLTLFTGLNALEAVPGAAGQGLADLCPLDSLTLAFLRDPATSRGMVYQKQQGAIPPNEANALLPGYRKLNPERVFWQPFQTWPDDPYGRAHFGPAVVEALTCLALRRDLLDSAHHTAWPRGRVGFNFTETYKIATEIMGYKDVKGNPAATNWVNGQLQQLIDYVEGLKSDDWLVHDTNGTSDIIQGGNMGPVDALLARCEHRLARALKQLPVMMGFNEGTTETHTTVQWQIVAKRLEKLRAFVLGIILKAATLHLRLLGLPFVAVARYEKLRTTDALIDAQTEGQKIRNAAAKLFLGAISHKQACMELTGTGPVEGTTEPTKDDLKTLMGASGGGGKPVEADQIETDKQTSGQTKGGK